MATKFYHCNVCGNVMAAVVSSGVNPFCCECQMDEMKPNTIDGKAESHVPVVERINECTIKVRVGKDYHPMTKEHHICFIVVETKDGAMMRYLNKCGAPEATFLCAEDPVAVYAYCNLHGLWRCNKKD